MRLRWRKCAHDTWCGFETVVLPDANASGILVIWSGSGEQVVYIGQGGIAKNLKWATLEEMIDHQQKSPAKIAYKKVQANRTVGLKLTASQVKTIKKTLSSKNRQLTIKKLAEKYKVSEMTMYRIKSGENWGRIK